MRMQLPDHATTRRDSARRFNARETDASAVVSQASETLKFQCNFEGVVLCCVASREFFEDCFGADHEPASWLAAYESHLDLIHDLVARRYQATGQSLVLLLTDYN